MISKQLSAVLNPGRQFILKKLNLISRNFLSTNSHTNLYYSKTISRFFTDKYHVNNFIIRQSHVNAAKQSYFITGDTFAYHCMEKSDAYSNTLASRLSFDQNLNAEEVESILQKPWISMSISEMLENFERLSIYAAKNEESINSSKYQGILEVLKNKLPDFSDQEIHHLLSCLELWKFENTEITYKSLLTTLDNECLKRMPNWSLEEILLTNDQFFKLRLSRFMEFTWHSLKKIGSKCKRMTPANLVQYAFFMKVNRRLPIRPYEVEYRVEQYFDSFSIEEVAIIAMAFIKYEAPIRSIPLLIKITQKLVNEIDNVNDLTMNAITGILRYNAEPELVNQLNILLKKLENQVSRLDIRTLTNILMLQKQLLIFNENLTSEILKRCEKEIKQIKLSKMENILNVLHIFNYDPQNTPFYSLAYKELLDPSRAEEVQRCSSSLINIVAYMLKQQFYPEEILKRVLDPEFINKTSNSNLYKLNPNYLYLDFCIELEHPEYNGPRPRKDAVNFLMKFFGSLKTKLKQNSNVSKVDKLITEIAHIIKKFTKSETSVHVDVVLPHVPKKSIIVCYDPETKEFLSPSEKLADIPIDTIKYAPDDGKKWYILTIGTYTLLTRDDSHKITGLLANEIRQLDRIGYTPIIISQYEWQTLANESDKQNYLKNLLLR